MKAIIMAAGIGSRLSGIIGGKPKCLIAAHGETLVERMVRILKSRNVDDITVITGYQHQTIHRVLGTEVRYFHNPLFSVTNSITSLWLAKDLLDDDVILMNADLYVEETVIDLVLAQTKPVVMLSDCTRIEDADFRFGVQRDRIVKTGNQLKNTETDCEYVGIVRIDKSFIAEFKTRLEHMIQRADFRNWWEGVLYSFIEDGVVINHTDVAGTFWTEVDHLGDLQRLNAWVMQNPSAAANINSDHILAS